MPSSKGFRPIHLVGLLLAAAILWLLYPAILALLGRAGLLPQEQLDPFAGADALFAAFAFAALIAAILLQREELRLQREELSATREELAGQRAQLQRQADFVASQHFNDGFYRLLTFHVEFVRGLHFPLGAHGSFSGTGRQVFDQLWSWLDGVLAEHTRKPDTGNQLRGKLAEMIRVLESVSRVDLMQYLRNLEVLLRHIDGAPQPERVRALEALRAQLSRSEHHVINYYLHSRDGVLGIRDLAERYGLLVDFEPSEVAKHFQLLPNGLYERRAP